MTADKVRTREAVAEECEALRRQGRRVVFTNGCFDLLHVGHVHTLEQARAMGDFLVVGVNADVSVRALKGPERPLVGEADRARMLAAFACVDRVVLFPEATPVETLDLIRPAVHVKGGDYTGQRLPEQDTVERHGGEVRFVPFVEGRSTTSLLRRMSCPVTG